MLSLPRLCTAPPSPAPQPRPLELSGPAPKPEGPARPETAHDVPTIDPQLARDNAQAAPSLEGHLRDRLTRMGWGDGDDYARQSSPGKDYASAMRSPIFNPLQKTLSPEHLDELKALVAKHEQLVAEATHEEGRLRTDAHVRALDRGALRTIENPRAENPLDPAQATAVQQQGRTMQQQILQEAGRTMGKAGVDFIFTILTSSQPDGVSRSSYVFVERAKEPDYFRALDAMKARIVERDRDLAAFFNRL